MLEVLPCSPISLNNLLAHNILSTILIIILQSTILNLTQSFAHFTEPEWTPRHAWGRVKNELAAPWEHSGLVCSLTLYKVPGFLQQVNSFTLRLSWATVKHSWWQINCVIFSGKYLTIYTGIWKMFTTVFLILLLLGVRGVHHIHILEWSAQYKFWYQQFFLEKW